MIKIKKRPQRYVTITDKMAIMNYLGEQKPFDEWNFKYSAFQMRELRDYLMDYLKQYYEKIKEEGFDQKQVENKMVSIQNYYHNQDCRETIDACLHETCLGSDPSCFSNKMRGRISIIVEEILAL